LQIKQNVHTTQVTYHSLDKLIRSICSTFAQFIQYNHLYSSTRIYRSVRNYTTYFFICCRCDNW